MKKPAGKNLEIVERVAIRIAVICALSACLDPARADASRRGHMSPAQATGVECAGRRPDVERTIQHDDPAVRQALAFLGQAVNPVTIASPEQIREIFARIPGAGAPPAGLNAFRAPGDASDPIIYLNRSSLVYTEAAAKPTALALLKLAATLVHEQVHNTDGELAAYRLQSDFVRSRLPGIPWRQREAARRYARSLDSRAYAIERLTGRRGVACGPRFR